MSTRANIILVTSDRVHQLYHHFDGYLSCVGENLRRKLIYSIGFSCIAKDVDVADVILSELLKDEEYEDEYSRKVSDSNCIHSDIEYLYVVRDSRLYYVSEFGLCDKFTTYKDLIEYVCKDCNELKLAKSLSNSKD